MEGRFEEGREREREKKSGGAKGSKGFSVFKRDEEVVFFLSSPRERGD